MHRSSQQALQVQRRMQKIIRDMARIQNKNQALPQILVKSREVANLQKKMLGK